MKPFLVLQLRPEDAAADGEFRAILAKSGLSEDDVVRVRCETDAPFGTLDSYSGVIVGGGPGCVSDDPATRNPVEARAEARVFDIMPEVTARDFPFLGCCYGIGILGKALGGRVDKSRYSEPVGPAWGKLTEDGRKDALLCDHPDEFALLVGHKEALQALPDGAVHLIEGDVAPFQMIRYGENVYATQFHPESDGEVFADRIKVYGSHGYFKPEETERIIRDSRAADATHQCAVLKRFAERYG